MFVKKRWEHNTNKSIYCEKIRGWSQNISKIFQISIHAFVKGLKYRLVMHIQCDIGTFEAQLYEK